MRVNSRRALNPQTVENGQYFCQRSVISHRRSAYLQGLMSSDERPTKKLKIKGTLETNMERDDSDEHVLLDELDKFLSLIKKTDSEKYAKFIELCKEYQMKLTSLTECQIFAFRIALIFEDIKDPSILARFRKYFPVNVFSANKYFTERGLAENKNIVDAIRFLESVRDTLGKDSPEYKKFRYYLEEFTLGKRMNEALEAFKKTLGFRKELFYRFLNYLPEEFSMKLHTDMTKLWREQQRLAKRDHARDSRANRALNRQRRKDGRRQQERIIIPPLQLPNAHYSRTYRASNLQRGIEGRGQLTGSQQERIVFPPRQLPNEHDSRANRALNRRRRKEEEERRMQMQKQYEHYEIPSIPSSPERTPKTSQDEVRDEGEALSKPVPVMEEMEMEKEGRYGELGPSYRLYSTQIDKSDTLTEVVVSRPSTALVGEGENNNFGNAEVSEHSTTLTNIVSSMEDNFSMIDVRISVIATLTQLFIKFARDTTKFEYGMIKGMFKGVIRQLYNSSSDENEEGSVNFGDQVLSKLQTNPALVVPIIKDRLVIHLDDLRNLRQRLIARLPKIETMKEEFYVNGETAKFLDRCRKEVKFERLMAKFLSPNRSPTAESPLNNPYDGPYFEKKPMGDIRIHMEIWKWVLAHGNLKKPVKETATVMWRGVVLPLLGIMNSDSGEATRFVEKEGTSVYYGDDLALHFFCLYHRVYSCLEEIRKVCRELDAKKPNANALLLREFHRYPAYNPPNGYFKLGEITGNSYLEKFQQLAKMKFEKTVSAGKYNRTIRAHFGMNCFPVFELTNCNFQEFIVSIKRMARGNDRYARLFHNKGKHSEYYKMAKKLEKENKERLSKIEFFHQQKQMKLSFLE